VKRVFWFYFFRHPRYQAHINICTKFWALDFQKKIL